MVAYAALPWIRFAVPLLLSALLLPAAAWCQDRPLGERLERVERDLNMLQRQVYRGAPSAMAASDPGAAANVEVRMERVEAQMRDLTGRVEEVANGLAQLKQRLEQINSDIDVRMGQSADASPNLPPAPGRPTMPRQPDVPRMASAGAPAPGTLVPPPGAGSGGGGGLTPIFNTLRPPGSPSAAPPPHAAAEPAAAGADLPSGSPQHQFNYAFGLVKQANYAAAEEALKAFIRRHPNDPLAGNAQYWLGETYYARSKYMDAATAFAEGYKRYPKGQKAADELLKLAMALARADQKKSACVALNQLDQAFPHPSAAIRDRAAAERKRVGCN